MNSKSASQLVDEARRWLSQDAIPTWTRLGVDENQGGFYEGISFAGETLRVPRRTLVQGRQIYSFRTARELGAVSAPSLVAKAAEKLLRDHALPSGAFLHSVDDSGRPAETKSELYTQAFALFGLANAFAETREEKYRIAARALLAYLNRERRAPGGGYTELTKSGLAYESNPHMHLYEAALAWMRVDSGREWGELADQLADLTLQKFIDGSNGILAEHFHEGWEPIRENGAFVFEPGHQFEWAWLLAVHEELSGKDLGAARRRLYQNGEKYGIRRSGQPVAYDEVWSDLRPKKKTSRYWPQCERAKAAVRLGRESRGAERSAYAASADEAIGSLFLFLATPVRGLCFDTMEEDGSFSAEPPKASCLYHIVNALDEYIRIRPELG